MIGASGTVGIQGTDVLQPTQHGWEERNVFGQGGAGHNIYSAVRSYRMEWQLISQSDLFTLINFFNTVSATGTVAVDLPMWGASTYQYTRYSGCILDEPRVSEHFTDHTTQVTLLVRNIVT